MKFCLAIDHFTHVGSDELDEEGVVITTTNGPQDIGHHYGGQPLAVTAERHGIEHEASIVQALLDAHVACCFRAPRGKKEESRQECIRDCMAAALALALAVHDDACGRCRTARLLSEEPWCQEREDIEGLAKE